MEYDAVIVGASFAGLAVAGELKGCKVLLIDNKPIGARRTSTCGTVYNFAREIGCEESVLEVFNEGVVYTPSAEISIRFAKPFCTFDYSKFCNGLNRGGFDFLTANAKGVGGSKVVTSKGSFKGKAIVDCSGWQAVLASSINSNFVDMRNLSVGIETDARVKEDRLAYYIDPAVVRNGAAWVFPVGREARVGVGRYEGGGNLMPELKAFLKRFGRRPGRLTGNYVPTKMREPVVGSIFLVGDSAGQAIPLTVEGIRKSIIYGKKCGEVIKGIVSGEAELEAGLEEYSEFVNRSRKYYRFMRAVQKVPSLDQEWLTEAVCRVICSDVFSGFFLSRYLRF